MPLSLRHTYALGVSSNAERRRPKTWQRRQIKRRAFRLQINWHAFILYYERKLENFPFGYFRSFLFANKSNRYPIFLTEKLKKVRILERRIFFYRNFARLDGEKLGNDENPPRWILSYTIRQQFGEAMTNRFGVHSTEAAKLLLHCCLFNATG